MHFHKSSRFLLGFSFVLIAFFISLYDAFQNTTDNNTVGTDTLTLAEAPQNDVELCDVTTEEKPDSEEPLHVQKGDTLSGVLARANISNDQVNAAIMALKTVFNPRQLKPEHDLFVTTSGSSKESDKRNLLSLLIRPKFEEEILIEQDETGGYKATKQERKITKTIKAAQGKIDNSLYIAASQVGVPGKIIHEMIKAYSYEVDFQRNLKSGDEFELMFELFEDQETGKSIPGDLLFACLKLEGKPSNIYRFQHKDGSIGYYNEAGMSIRKAILQTPVDGARISSGFGFRHHPILGYNKMHKGIDFAVGIGTPVMAAGDGVIEKAGLFSTYGKYVRIRHTNGYKTAYAHLSRFQKGLRVGHRVRQGQVIAYSGNTGRSAGAHLHYEILLNDKHINPRTVKKLPGGEKLSGKILESFKFKRSEMEKMYIALNTNIQPETQLAKAETSSASSLHIDAPKKKAS